MYGIKVPNPQNARMTALHGAQLVLSFNLLLLLAVRGYAHRLYCGGILVHEIRHVPS